MDDPSYSVQYSYDDLGRFSSVSSSVSSVSSVVDYSYLTGSSLISGYTTDSGLAVSCGFEDNRNNKTQVLNQFGTNVISQFDYQYDELNRRTQRLDTSFASLPSVQTNLFDYNGRSELTSAAMSTNDYSYAYDSIGNRLTASTPLTSSTYVANSLNQYDWTISTNCSTSTVSTNAMTYDADGNLTNDSVNAYTWNGENRLIAVAPVSPTNGAFKCEFAYDAQGRRISKDVYQRDSSQSLWSKTQSLSFVYDGWNLIEEIDPAMVVSNVSAYTTNQDGQNYQPTSASVIENGRGVQLIGNAWKRIPLAVGLATNAVLSFEIRVENEGEIIAVGLDNDNTFENPNRLFQLCGRDPYASCNHDYNILSTGRWVSVSIPVGSYYVGSMTHLTLVADDDALGACNVSFRNISLTQGGDIPTAQAKYYTWGLDLSGSTQGAGGVGGLLSVTVLTNSTASTYLMTYDANGNVTDYILTNGTIAAHYEYDPYGNEIQVSGFTSQVSFPFRFSTKYLDCETGLYYYGYRYYNPEMGRWLNRDPIEERGGVNIYGFIHNEPVGAIDVLGLTENADPCKCLVLNVTHIDPGGWFSSEEISSVPDGGTVPESSLWGGETTRGWAKWDKTLKGCECEDSSEYSRKGSANEF